MRLHADVDADGLRGEELRHGPQRLRRHDQLRIVHGASDLRRRISERPQRLRLHPAHAHAGMCRGTELRPRAERLRWKRDLRGLHITPNLWWRRHRRPMRMHPQLPAMRRRQWLRPDLHLFRLGSALRRGCLHVRRAALSLVFRS